MQLDDEYKNELIKKYRTELFEKENIDINEIDDLISNEDLLTLFKLNNSEMCELVNQQTFDKEMVKRLLIANINLYKLAKYRGIGIHGSSFLFMISSTINYDIDRIYDELTVGRYKRPFRR